MSTAIIQWVLYLALAASGGGGLASGWRKDRHLLVLVLAGGVLAACLFAVVQIGVEASHGWPLSRHDNINLTYGMMGAWAGGALLVIVGLMGALAGRILRAIASAITAAAPRRAPAPP